MTVSKNLPIKERLLAEAIAAEVAEALAPLLEPLVQAAMAQSRRTDVYFAPAAKGEPARWRVPTEPF
jgi:hypothetical protein